MIKADIAHGVGNIRFYHLYIESLLCQGSVDGRLEVAVSQLA
jgi:hypothetical protein